MCGPSQDENITASRESSLAATLGADYNQRFADQSGVLDSLRNMFTPIAEAGPDQQGFGANELAALNTSAGEGVGANYAKASQALNNTLAARGDSAGTTNFGAKAALKASLASAGANELSREQTGITEANYAQGRSNYNQATAGLNALAGEYNPAAFGSLATNANESSFGMEKTINQQKNQLGADIFGGITALAGPLTGGIANLDFAGTSSPGEQVGNFFGGLH